MAWFDIHERDLPWRQSDPWGVFVSEIMLQQTPVVRVLPVWQEWMKRWPEPADLATSSVADALRAWGRLGYPRRARRLHEAAGVMVADHGGQVPRSQEALLALPGVGSYTAAAVRAFAYGERAVVLDVNIRRVLARALTAQGQPAAHITSAERQQADLLWPTSGETSARWSEAVMELGALVCTARSPRCDDCPISHGCAWLDSGQEVGSPTKRQQVFEGSDRQARGVILAHLRQARGSVPVHVVRGDWEDDIQFDRALDGLLSDGLVEQTRAGRLRLATK